MTDNLSGKRHCGDHNQTEVSVADLKQQYRVHNPRDLDRKPLENGPVDRSRDMDRRPWYHYQRPCKSDLKSADRVHTPPDLTTKS